jgi:preprotein translocase subunit SecG
MLHTTLMVVHFFSAASIVALVLLQRGKGADAGAGFGAGASGTVFGARGAGTALSRTTAILAVVFMITSLSLTYVGSRSAAPPSTILERLSQRPANLPATSAPAPTGAGAPAAAGTAAPAAPTTPAQ